MTGEHLFILVMMGLVLLVNLIARVLRRWIGRGAPRQGGPEAPSAPPPQPRLPQHVVQPRRVREGPQGLPMPPVIPPAIVRRRAPVGLGGRRELRRAIVLITILGPCRALEPPDDRA